MVPKINTEASAARKRFFRNTAYNRLKSCNTNKARSPARSGQIPVVSFRLEPEWRQEIDEWRSGEPGHPSRSDAVRMLIGMGLSAAYAKRKIFMETLDVSAFAPYIGRTRWRLLGRQPSVSGTV